MAHDLKDDIERKLLDMGYHPDLAKAADNELQRSIEEYGKADRLAEMMNMLRAKAYDATLMQEKYFVARVEFLARLSTYLGERPEQTLDVAEDGCGTGVDMAVLRSLLGDKLSLTGVDLNEASLSVARQRVADASFAKRLAQGAYDVVYADFLSAGNDPFQVYMRGETTAAALRPRGVAMHNTDVPYLELHCRAFGAKFARVLPPELLASVPDNYDCYLYRFEKE